MINGTSGIAVGFACNILPRSIQTVIAETKRCLKNPEKYLKDNKPVVPVFPHFHGSVTQLADLQWQTAGTIEYIGKYTYKISELPIGYDRESYIGVLNTLLDGDKIKDYEDNCSEAGFGFTIKVTVAQKEKIDLDQLKYFKLTKTHNENLTTLDVNGKLKIFNSIAELVHYFCLYRLSKFGEKIQYQINELETDNKEIADKAKFIKLVIDRKIDFRVLSREQLLSVIVEKVTKSDYGKKFINIPLYACTTDAIESLEAKKNDNEQQLLSLKKTTPMERYLSVI